MAGPVQDAERIRAEFTVELAARMPTRPIQALTELVWNALDADAFDVKVDVIQNPLGGIDAIRVTDDGLGINALQFRCDFFCDFLDALANIAFWIGNGFSFSSAGACWS